MQNGSTPIVPRRMNIDTINIDDNDNKKNRFLYYPLDLDLNIVFDGRHQRMTYVIAIFCFL